MLPKRVFTTFLQSTSSDHPLRLRYSDRKTESKMAPQFDDLTAILYKKDDLRLEQKKPREPGTGEVDFTLNFDVYSV